MLKVLITGCSKGIGRITAQEFAKRGYEVIATARDPKTLEGLNVAERLALDVTDDNSVAAAKEAVGDIDVLVNNAGIIAVGPVEAVPIAEAKHLYETNVFGTLRMIQAFVPSMRKRGHGTVVNLSSIVGRVTMPLTGIYASTKWAIEALSDALRFEVGHFGVRVIVIEPGATATGALDAPKAFLGDGAYEPLTAHLDFKSGMLPPEDVAQTIVEAVESEDKKFRWPVGEGAQQLLSTRATMDDATFEQALRSLIGSRW